MLEIWAWMSPFIVAAAFCFGWGFGVQFTVRRLWSRTVNK